MQSITTETNDRERAAELELSPRLQEFGLSPLAVKRLHERVSADVASNLYPGAAVAFARHGEVVAEKVFGVARLATPDAPEQLAANQTLWLLYSQTKPVTSCAVWILAERGLLNLHVPVAHYIPDFAREGKGAVTAYHLLTHQAGFPNANVSESAWNDHEQLLREICDIPLDWQPGSRVYYHSYSAHWVLALLIEKVSGQDFRTFITKEVLKQAGLQNFFVGVPESERGRLAGSYECKGPGQHVHAPEFDKPSFYASGMPGAGGYATAGDVAMFYQMLLADGAANGNQIVSPQMVRYATRNHTADRPDDFFGAPMHRALGVHVRGTTPTLRGLGSTASPSTFGHGGVGTSYSFADPVSGVSFTYLTNSRLAEPGHTRRLEEIMCIAHSAISGSKRL
jgi:CubicO group peptidase (beta-lactamase class C family)